MNNLADKDQPYVPFTQRCNPKRFVVESVSFPTGFDLIDNEPHRQTSADAFVMKMSCQTKAKVLRQVNKTVLDLTND